MLVGAQTDTSAEAIEPLVNAKLARQAVLDRAEVTALMDELVLYRLIGSPEIMYEQLMRVAEISERPNVCVQVVPTEVAATAGLSGEICIAQGDGIPDTLHTDATPEGHTTDSPSLVRGAAVAFERVRRHALPSAMSRDLIMKVANDRWKTQQQTGESPVTAETAETASKLHSVQAQ